MWYGLFVLCYSLLAYVHLLYREGLWATMIVYCLNKDRNEIMHQEHKIMNSTVAWMLYYTWRVMFRLCLIPVSIQ